MANERLKIALAGNPNSGKTTLFNALTGSNQYVGNWPGVTVEKKEGKLKKHPDVIIEDLPGIYSLSPYTLEEVVSRNYLIGEHPDAILNIVDGTNLERNLYLTTQLLEIGVPVVVAVNMMDLVKKADDKININALSEKLGCKIVEISALKETGIMEAAEAAIAAAEAKSATSIHKYEDKIETALSKITDSVLTDVPADQKRWYAIKVFERDEKVLARLNLNESQMAEVEKIVSAVEKDLDDDAESIITNARYTFITETLNGIYTKQNAGKLSVSDKIDNIVTNRWLGLPIFAVVMFIVYFVSIQTFGTGATDWVNDGLFGDGWFWFGLGRAEFDEDSGAYKADQEANQAFIDEAIEKGYISSSENDEGEQKLQFLNQSS